MCIRDRLADIGLLNTDCMTVTGKTVGENIKNAVNRDPEVCLLYTSMTHSHTPPEELSDLRHSSRYSEAFSAASASGI